MIALTKYGYEKFIRGETNIFGNNIKVAPLAEGITNATFTRSGVDAKRLEANTNKPEYDITNLAINYKGIPGSAVTDQNNVIKWEGEVTMTGENFVTQDNAAVLSIDQVAAVIDTSNNDEPLGLIKIYPTGNAITYAALNSAPVNIDYTTTGMAQLKFKASYALANSKVDATGFNITDMFQKGILKLPFFDNTVTSNLLTDLRIALLSAEDPVAGNDPNTGAALSVEGTFANQLFIDSKTIGTIKEMDTDSKYTYISGGFKFENLGFDATFATLTADDTTVHIPGLTINDAKVFAIVYFEDTSAITASTDVMSDTYQQNSHILTSIENVDNQAFTRFAFKQSVIIDALAAGAFEMSPGAGVSTYGILAMNNVVGPEFTGNVNRNGDLPNS